MAMKNDLQAFVPAFYAIANVSSILKEALEKGQDFKVTVDSSKNDGSCDVVIHIEPSKPTK
jgi:hypothetical protein